MKKNQRGATLVVSLVLLLVMTVIGISSIGNVTFNQKMATSFRDSSSSFQAAEAALAEGEALAESLTATISEAIVAPGCTGTQCFTATCNNGKCFNGSYPYGNPCVLEEPFPQLAKQEATWDTAGRALDSQQSFPGLARQPQIIVEFICNKPTDHAYFYRITSYARGAKSSSRTMLQSTYKVVR